MTFDLRAVAATYREVFGAEVRVTRHHLDADEQVWVDIARCADRPEDGVTCWATLAMSRFDTDHDTGDGRELRVELVGEIAGSVDTFGSMLASCAFNIASGEYGLTADTIFPDVVRQYVPDVTTAHLLLTDVFSFEGLTPVEGDGEVLAFLQAVPVTDEEFRFARVEGVDALTALLESRGVDVRDPDRRSVVDADGVAADPTVYCERFDPTRCQPVVPITEQQARQRYVEGPAFTVVIDPGDPPDEEEGEEGTTLTVRPPRAVLDVDAGASRVLTSFYERDGSLGMTFLFRRRGDRLFFEQLDQYGYAPDVSQGPANVVVHEQFWFHPDGVAHRASDDAGADTVTTEDRRDVPVEAHWEPVPVFGDWESIARENR